MRRGDTPSIVHGFMLGGDISSFGRLKRGSLAGIVAVVLGYHDVCVWFVLSEAHRSYIH